MSNAKFGAKEVMDVVLYDMETDKPVIQFDSLKTFQLALPLRRYTQEAVRATLS